MWREDEAWAGNEGEVLAGFFMAWTSLALVGRGVDMEPRSLRRPVSAPCTLRLTALCKASDASQLKGGAISPPEKKPSIGPESEQLLLPGRTARGLALGLGAVLWEALMLVAWVSGCYSYAQAARAHGTGHRPS